MTTTDDRIGALYQDKDSRMDGRMIVVLSFDEDRGKYRTQNTTCRRMGWDRGYTYVSAKSLDTRFRKVTK